MVRRPPQDAQTKERIENLLKDNQKWVDENFETINNWFRNNIQTLTDSKEVFSYNLFEGYFKNSLKSFDIREL